MSDERQRYRAARELAALSPVALARLRERLDQAGGAVVLSGVTRDVGRRAVGALEPLGVSARLVETPLFASAEVPELGRRVSGGGVPTAAIGVAAILAALAVVWLLRRSPSAPAAGAPPAPSKDPEAVAAAPAPTPPSSRDLAAAALESTAGLRCGGISGAGFFVAPDLLLTNAHVICPDRSSLEITLHDGRKLPATVQAIDEWLDAAVLRVPGAAARPLALGDATRLEPGDSVLFIGSPLGMDFTVSRAIVSHPRRNMYGISFVQFDANVNHGNSGGPLLDTEGRAVGIVSMMLADSRGIAFALPINYVHDLPGASLPVGDPPPDFEAWRRVLAAARQEDAVEAAAAREAYRRPGLGGAAVDPDGHLFAFVVTLGQPAGSRPYRFAIRRGGEILCRPSGLVDTWGKSSASRASAMQDPRMLRWLSRIDLGGDLYSGRADLSLDGCPPAPSLVGAELDLEDADPGAAKTVIDVVRIVR